MNSATAARQRFADSLASVVTLQTVLSAFRVLPTIPQTFPHFWIPHFTFRIPQFRILPITVLVAFTACLHLWALALMTHCTAHKVRDKGESYQMHRQVGQWTLGGICWFYMAMSTQTLFTFGFGFRPKVPLYFWWHIRFWPNVLRHFRPTFSFG